MTNLEHVFQKLLTIQIVSVLFTHINRKGSVSSLFNHNQSMFWYSHTGMSDLYSALDQLPVWEMLSSIDHSNCKPPLLFEMSKNDGSHSELIFDLILSALFNEKKTKRLFTFTP